MIVDIVKIRSDSDYLSVWDSIPEDFLSHDLMDLMRCSLGSSIRSLVIEYPYVDKDYRSTYYGFYSKRHREYGKFCFRLHFFAEDLENSEEVYKISGGYLGSMVLRPTEVTPLGRTLLSPRAIAGFKGFVAEAEFENNLMGIPLKLKTFPHIMQDTDVTVCAHAVCWMIARYYSEKYTIYPERLSFDIAEAVRDLSEGRIIPSRGLTLGQVSEVLASIGFYPEIFVKELYDDPDFFYDLLYCYVESGIPLVGAMGEKEHAVAIIGHGPLQPAMESCQGRNGFFVSSRHCIDQLVVNDDNRLPFSFLPRISEDSINGISYSLEDIDSFVVPQYEKMYLNAENVLHLYPKLVTGLLLEIPQKRRYQ